MVPENRELDGVRKYLQQSRAHRSHIERECHDLTAPSNTREHRWFASFRITLCLLCEIDSLSSEHIVAFARTRTAIGAEKNSSVLLFVPAAEDDSDFAVELRRFRGRNPDLHTRGQHYVASLMNWSAQSSLSRLRPQ